MRDVSNARCGVCFLDIPKEDINKIQSILWVSQYGRISILLSLPLSDFNNNNNTLLDIHVKFT